MGFLKRIFGGGARKAESPLRGPLDAGPRDVIEYYQEKLRVLGVISLKEEEERRFQYVVADAEDRIAFLTIGEGSLSQMFLERPLPFKSDFEQSEVTVRGTTFTLTQQGTATSLCTGEIPAEKFGTVKYRRFLDEDEEESLVVEDWGGMVEARVGELLHDGEITVRRRGEKKFSLREPAKTDIHALIEERRRMDEERIVRNQDELLKAQERLSQMTLRESEIDEE